MSETFFSDLRIGRHTTAVVALSGFLAIFIDILFIFIIYFSVIFVTLSNIRDIKFPSEIEIGLDIRKRDGFFIYAVSFTILLTLAISFHAIYNFDIQYYILDKINIHAFSFFGLYERGEPSFQEIYNMGYQEIAVFSKFFQFVLSLMCISLICVFHKKYTRFVCFFSNIVFEKGDKIIIRIILFISSLPFLYLMYIVLSGDFDPNNFLKRYESNNKLSIVYFYSWAFAFWFVFVSGFFLPAVLMGRILRNVVTWHRKWKS